ncbi:MAG: metallophosphoesterase family protein [Planctomycetota bacterium]|jgi:hypothetical protein
MLKSRRSNLVGTCLLTVVLSLTLAISVAAAEAPEGSGLHPWTDRPFIDSGENFRFAIVSDNAGGTRPGIFADAVAKLNRLRPEFVMCVGDLIDGYEEEQAEIEEDWGEFFAILEPLEMRFFLLPGNHEVSNAAMSEYYTNNIGPLYYRFVHKNVLFICLNSQDGEYADWRYPTAISDAQVEHVRNALEENAGVRWTFVFMHQPLWDKGYEGSGWEKVQALLADRPHTVFGGHWHSYALYDIEGSKYIRLATTGGASDLVGMKAGSLDHVTWVAMTDGGPEISNLALDGIYPDDVSTSVTQRVYEVALWQKPVAAGSLVTEETAVDRIPIKVTMNNDTDVEMKTRAAVVTGEGLKVEPGEVRVAVAPRSTHEAEVILHAPKPLAVEELPPWRSSGMWPSHLREGRL